MKEFKKKLNVVLHVVVITRISDAMIPSVVIHPNANHFLGQILENIIIVYDCKNGFKSIKKN